MSETDDTDELLLIPPDFFASNPALDPNFSPYYSVVDSLISQVSQLENRLNLIESSSEFSLSLISDSPEMQSPSRRRKEGGSAQSTPQKPRTKFTLNSLPSSPDLEKLRASKGRREINPMLGEIDSFLSNVKFIKRLNAVRNLENDFNCTEGAARNLDMGQVNEMLKEIELQEKNEKPCVKTKNWQAGDNIESVPDLGYGIREKIYETKKTFTAGGSTTEKNDSDSSETTQETALENHNYKSNNYSLGLVSLSNLWNSSDWRDLPNKFQQKLQEEKLRRQVFSNLKF